MDVSKVPQKNIALKTCNLKYYIVMAALFPGYQIEAPQLFSGYHLRDLNYL